VDFEKRERVLDAAAEAFGEIGFRKTTVAEIAKQAGVAKGSVYLACESKGDLFYQVLHRELRRWLGEMAKLIDPHVPADELLTRIGERSMLYMETRPLMKSLFLGVFHGELPGFAERFDELRVLGQQYIAQILRLGVSQGIFRDDLDVQETAAILQDLKVSAIIYRTLQKADDEAARHRLKTALELVLHGLCVR